MLHLNSSQSSKHAAEGPCAAEFTGSTNASKSQHEPLHQTAAHCTYPVSRSRLQGNSYFFLNGLLSGLSSCAGPSLFNQRWHWLIWIEGLQEHLKLAGSCHASVSCHVFRQWHSFAGYLGCHLFAMADSAQVSLTDGDRDCSLDVWIHNHHHQIVMCAALHEIS